MTHVFFHNDPDGWCSAAVFNMWHQGTACFHECHYGMKFPHDALADNDTVYMLDFCLPVEEMEQIARKVKAFHWIDHHASAIKAMDGHGPIYRTTSEWFDRPMAACELAWVHYFPERAMPMVVQLIGAYDTWEWKKRGDKDAPALVAALVAKEAWCNDPQSAEWRALLLETDRRRMHNKRTMDLVLEGAVIMAAKKAESAEICRRAAFDTAIEAGGRSYTAVACNSALRGSALFDGVYTKEAYDVMLLFYWDADGNWTVSVYTEKEDVDCSAIAVAHGGGGHRGAAGFRCETLPFKLNKRTQREKEQ